MDTTKFDQMTDSGATNQITTANGEHDQFSATVSVLTVNPCAKIGKIQRVRRVFYLVLFLSHCVFFVVLDSHTLDP